MPNSETSAGSCSPGLQGTHCQITSRLVIEQFIAGATTPTLYTPVKHQDRIGNTNRGAWASIWCNYRLWENYLGNAWRISSFNQLYWRKQINYRKTIYKHQLWDFSNPLRWYYIILWRYFVHEVLDTGFVCYSQKYMSYWNNFVIYKHYSGFESQHVSGYVAGKWESTVLAGRGETSQLFEVKCIALYPLPTMLGIHYIHRFSCWHRSLK